MGQEEEPCGPTEALRSRSGCSQKPRDQDPHAGPFKQQPEALGATGTLRRREPKIPRCVTWGSSKHMSTTAPTPLRAPGTPHVPGPLLDGSQPREPEAREQEVAEAWLPESAESVAGQRSPCSRRRSKPLDEERASLFGASAGSSRLGGQGGTPSQVSTQSGAE